MDRILQLAKHLRMALWIGALVASPAVAAPKAWLINTDGDAVKLDLTQHVIVETRSLGIDKILIDDLGVDRIRQHLFVAHGRGPYLVGVFDLKTLKRKGTLDFKVDLAPTVESEAIRFVFPPTGREFFGRWWNPAAGGGTGGFEIATIDATTLQTTARRTPSPPLEEKLMLDLSGRQVYSMKAKRPARIDVFDIPGFTQTSTVDLEPLLNPGALGRDIADFGEGKVLLLENDKALRADRSRYLLSVFDVASGRLTPKIQTGLMGNAKLLPRTNRVIFDETTALRPGADLLRHGELVSLGNIHVYEMVTGARSATVRISSERYGEVLAATLAEDIFYYLSSATQDPRPQITVVSLGSLRSLSSSLNQFPDRG